MSSEKVQLQRAARLKGVTEQFVIFRSHRHNRGNLPAYFRHPEYGAAVWDPYDGTMAMGCPCLTLGRKYLPAERHDDLFDAAEMRLQQYVTGRLDNQGNLPSLTTYSYILCL
jgi:hypothetical protein